MTMNPLLPSDRLTLGHFTLQGWQDCNNAMDTQDFRDRGPEAYAKEFNEGRDEWIAQMPTEDYEGLDPVACFEAWRDSWIATAIEILIEHATARR
jgi:hypothetical protein